MLKMRLQSYVSSGDALSKIKRNWRDWENNHASDAVSPSGSGTNSAVNKRKSCSSGASAIKPMSKIPARAGNKAFKSNKSKNIISNEKFNSVQSSKKRNLNRCVIDDDILFDAIKGADLSRSDRAKFGDYLSAKNYSRADDMSKTIKSGQFDVNLDEAESLGLAYSKNRFSRLATSFARIIYKFGEDKFGADIEGDDFWCERMITERVVSRKNINHCKKSLQKDRIIIMLDSSPSCCEQSEFYSMIASIAAKFGDIEMYDAPNGRIVKAFSPRDKDFYFIFNEDDIINNAHKWSYLNNRNIILFTDDDSETIVRRNADRNNIILLTNSHTSPCAYMEVSSKIKHFKNVDTPADLINVAKKLK